MKDNQHHIANEAEMPQYETHETEQPVVPITTLERCLEKGYILKFPKDEEFRSELHDNTNSIR